MANKETENMGTELMVTSGFAALSNPSIVNDALMDDCQGMEFAPDKVSIPLGGGTLFEMPSETEDETESVKEITGVILYHHPAFAFYTDKYTGQNVPPECSSFDGVHGNGTPGGACATCEYNQYGSGEGKSKACKNKRFLYILREGEIFPIILSLPAGSLMPFTKYTKHQLSKMRRLNQIVTKISLKKAVSSTGITFSQAVFSFIRTLSEDEKPIITTMTEQMKQYAAGLNASALIEDVEEQPVVDPETGEVIEPLTAQ